MAWSYSIFDLFNLHCFTSRVFVLFNSQCFTKWFSIGLGIVFWFSQIFWLILMLLKNLSYFFKAFGQSGEMNFFSYHVHQLFFYIILSIYKKSKCLEAIVFLVCSTCTVSPATFFFLLMHKARVVLLYYFWFVQFAIFHKII